MLIACPHVQIRIRQRSKGQSAVAGAAYQAGEKLVSEYDNDHAQQDYRYKKPEVLHKEILLPPNAPSEFHDRQTLWNSVEMTEKQWNAQHGRDQRYTIKTEPNGPGARKMEGYTKMFPNIKKCFL